MADGSPVGSFIESGDDQKLSNCTPNDVRLMFACLYITIKLFYIVL